MSTFPGIEPRFDSISIEPRSVIEIEPRPEIESSLTDDEIVFLSRNQGVDFILNSPELSIRVFSDPALFCNTFLETDTWNTQKEIMEAVAAYPKVAVKACHSSSKTFSSAILTLWFLAAHEDSVVITTAPTHAQVEKLLWGEIHSALLRSKYPFPKANLTELKIGPKRYAYGLSTVVTKQDEGVKFQGFHAKNVLVIIDEAPGVNAKIWEAIEGARAGGNVHILAIGNPTIPSGPFHSAFTNSRSGWKCFTIDAFDNPNFCNQQTGERIDLEKLVKWGEESVADEATFVPTRENPAYKHPQLDYNPIPYLANRRWVLEQFHEWGVDHPFWESRVRGQFPKQSEYSLISLAWLEEQSRKEKGLGKGKVSAGIDVAGPGEAETSLTIRRGEEILVHKQWPISDPRGEIIMALEPFRGELDVVNVDAVAIGYYLYQHLLDLKFPVQPIIAQAPSSDNVKYADLKAEYYWSLRLQLSQGKFSGLTDERTIGQLAGIRWKPNSRGQIEIESKEQASKRGVKALALDTPIPIPNGWTTMGDIHPGDFVFSEEGKPIKVKSVTDPIEGMSCYSVQFSDGAEIVAESGHLWETHQQSQLLGLTRSEAARRAALIQWGKFEKSPFKPLDIRTTEQIKNTLYYGPNNKYRNHHISVSKALDLPEVNLPIPPYVLGAWLGDGDSDCPRITIGRQDEEEMIDLIRAEGIPINPSSTPFSFKMGVNGKHHPLNNLRNDLNQLGVLNNKHIPNLYLRSSVEQRFALLQGLLDTDGSPSKDDGEVEISSSYPKLIRGIEELLHSLGFKIGRSIGLPKQGLIYTVFSFMAYSDTPVFRLKRKLTKQPQRPDRKPLSTSRAITGVEDVPSIPVRCITVDSPSGLFLAGSHMIPTHNSPDRAESVMLAFGSKIQVYGALEYFSNLKKDIEEGKAQLPGEASVLKSVLPDKQLICEICKSTCISMAQGDWRCGQCGHQWNDKQKKHSIEMSRAEAMILMNAKKRKF
jgi:hypothetical protein